MLPERIRRKFTERPDGCWAWTGALSTSGYGRVHWQGKLRQAHRVVYELTVGPIPDGMDADHVCRNKACVNPAHIQPVTHWENVVLRGRGPIHRNYVAETCPQGHPLSGDNLYVAPNGWRQCRECRRVHSAAAQFRRRAQLKAAGVIGPAPSEKTHCTNGHPFDEANTRITKQGHRVCRACNRIRSREHARKKRVAASLLDADGASD